jgi:hypothetical protein
MRQKSWLVNTTKIHGELLKLGIQAAQSTVSIVHNHTQGIASIDLFLVPVMDPGPIRLGDDLRIRHRHTTLPRGSHHPRDVQTRLPESPREADRYPAQGEASKRSLTVRWPPNVLGSPLEHPKDKPHHLLKAGRLVSARTHCARPAALTTSFIAFSSNSS